MPKKTIEEVILRNVVTNYIETLEPIGSTQLKYSLDLRISPATIRNYFKKLVAQGYLDKLHSSSGRIPTSQAFREYWQDELCEPSLAQINDDCAIEKKCDAFGIYSVMTKKTQNVFENLIVIEGKYLILEFEQGHICIEYDENLAIFLQELLGLSAFDLLKISYENMIDPLLDPLKGFLQKNTHSFNDDELFKISQKNKIWSKRHLDDFLSGHIIHTTSYGLHFENVVPKEHLLVKMQGVQEDVPISIMALGHLSRDFGQFFRSIIKEDDAR